MRTSIKVITGFINSTIVILKKCLSRQRADVIFYYPSHFNRDKGQNPFFAPLVDLCKREKLHYIVLEEPAGGVENPESMKADALYWFVWLVRKILIGGFNFTQHRADKCCGRLIDTLTFHRLRAKTYITISNSMIDVLASINPHGAVFDMQHGIIYRGHPGYFSGNSVQQYYLEPNRRVLLWGPLYKRNLVDIAGLRDPDDKFIVVGYPMYKSIPIITAGRERQVLVSGQFVESDQPVEALERMLTTLDDFMHVAVEAGYTVVLKHHPRYEGRFSLDKVLQKYGDRVTVTRAPLSELVASTRLHVTWSSTTTMEYAAHGIPTFLISTPGTLGENTLFYAQYQYPLYRDCSPSSFFERVTDEEAYHRDCLTVKEWYEQAYSPLDNPLLLNILKGKQ